MNQYLVCLITKMRKSSKIYDFHYFLSINFCKISNIRFIIRWVIIWCNNTRYISIIQWIEQILIMNTIGSIISVVIIVINIVVGVGIIIILIICWIPGCQYILNSILYCILCISINIKCIGSECFSNLFYVCYNQI